MESPFHLYTCIVWYCIVFFQASSFQSDTNIPSFELVPSMIPAIICITFTKGCLMRSRNLGCWCGKYIAAVPNAKTIHLSQIHPKKNALLSVNKTIFPFFKQLKNQDHRLPLTLYTKKKNVFLLLTRPRHMMVSGSNTSESPAFFWPMAAKDSSFNCTCVNWITSCVTWRSRLKKTATWTYKNLLVPSLKIRIPKMMLWKSNLRLQNMAIVSIYV